MLKHNQKLGAYFFGDCFLLLDTEVTWPNSVRLVHV